MRPGTGVERTGRFHRRDLAHPMSPLLVGLVLWLVAINVTTFVAFGIDKRAAKRGTWRTRERTLLLMELAGGFLGGWLGMRVLRHKTLHRSFRAMPAVAAVLWIGAVALLWLAGR